MTNPQESPFIKVGCLDGVARYLVEHGYTLPEEKYIAAIRSILQSKLGDQYRSPSFEQLEAVNVFFYDIDIDQLTKLQLQQILSAHTRMHTLYAAYFFRQPIASLDDLNQWCGWMREVQLFGWNTKNIIAVITAAYGYFITGMYLVPRENF